MFINKITVIINYNKNIIARPAPSMAQDGLVVGAKKQRITGLFTLRR
jgi:hypothetical protein